MPLGDAQPIDPRDIAWEVDAPTYRVSFWRRDGSAADEWPMTEAVSVHEVLTWADARLDEDSTDEVFVDL